MKKNAIILLLIMGSMNPFISSVARPPGKFGDINKRNLELDVCFLDSSASAYYIFDFGEAYFDFNTNGMTLEYHARIKILNSNGFSYANLKIPYYAGKPVTKLRAATYNLVDGKVVTTKVDKKMIFDEKVSGDLRQLKISFPDVREGSIIEYTYHKTTGDYVHLVPWVFQTNIPVMYSEFNLRIPDYFQYKYVEAGYEVVDIFTKKRTVEHGSIPSTVFHWVMKDVPALKEEPYMPDLNNYYSRIEFELMYIQIPGQATKNFLTTWEEFEKELIKDEDYGLIPGGWHFLKDSVDNITANKEGKESIQAIHDFIARHVKWNGKNRIYASGTARKVYKTGRGNSADINLMYAGLMQLAGFEAKPVMLSTRDHGIIRDYGRPFLAKYNYTMAWARDGEKEYLLDATDPFLPARLIPANCLNGKGRVIMNHGKWVKLEVPRGVNENTLYVFNITEEGDLEGSIQVSHNGYVAASIRKKIDTQGEDKYIENVKKDKSEWSVQDYQILNLPETTKPLVEKIKCTIEGKVENMGDILVLNPLIDPDWKENPFKEEKRMFPVDFIAPRNKRIILNYSIPEGYTVDEIPLSTRISMPDKGIIYTYYTKVVDEKHIQIVSSLNMKKYFYSQKDYDELKKFFDEVLAKQAEQVVLKKTG